MGNSTPKSLKGIPLWIQFDDDTSRIRGIRCPANARLRDALKLYNPNWRSRVVPMTIHNEPVSLRKKVASFGTSREAPLILRRIPGTPDELLESKFALGYVQE